MSIIKISNRTKYTVVDNSVINDSGLDFDALGLLVYLLSKPSNWNVSVKMLAKQKKSGETKIKRLLKVLQANGYAGWYRLKTGKTEWVIYEKPQVENELEGQKPQVEKPHVENPQEEKPHVEIHPDIISTERQISTDNKVTTEREVKEAAVATFKNIKLNIPGEISKAVAKEFINHRINIKRKSTQEGFERSMAQAVKTAHELHMSADDVITESIDAGWQGVGKPEWIINRRNKTGAYSHGNNSQGSGSHNETPFERNERLAQQARESAVVVMDGV